MDPGWIAAAVGLATALCLLGLWAVRTAWKWASRLTRFLDDYFGEPALAGLPARPGVMARLGAVEMKLADIAAEVHPNSGHSLRDDVQRTAQDMASVKSTVEALTARVERMGGRT